jgi:hypothetical protein
MRWLNALLIIFSLLSIGLGIYGFSEKGSAVSLIAGGAAGFFMLATVYWAQSQPRWARIASLLIAVGMLIKFLPTFLKDGNWLRGGIMAIASAVIIVALLAGHMMGMQARKSASPSGG